MQIPRNRIFRGLALTTVYLMGIFGIVASGGGGSGDGDGDGSVIVNSILLNQPASPTYETDIQIIGLLEVITPPLNSKGDEYSDTVKVSWRNELTGQSGTHNHRFSGKCSVELILVPFPIPIPAPQLVCTITAHESPLGLPIIALAMGSNKITVEARGKTAFVEVMRLEIIPLVAPSGVAVQAADDQATVSWNTVAGATSYNIYYASSPGVTKSNYSTLPDGNKLTGASSPQAITGLVNGIDYYFVVTAAAAYGESVESSEVMTNVVGEPTGVSIDEATNNRAVVSWNTVAGATSYNIYYASSPGVTKSNYSTLPDGNKLTDASSPQAITGLVNGIDYYFVVTAKNSFGESLESLELIAHIGPTLSFDIKTFRFTWTDVPDATHYRLLENPDGVSGFSQVGSDIPQGTGTVDHIVSLYKRVNASYILQSCVGGDCTDFSLFNINDNLVEAIGYFKASNTGRDDYFGYAVSLSNDGKTLAISAPGESSNASGIDGDQLNNSMVNSGAVYLFSHNNGIWSQQAYIKASNTGSTDGFGNSVSLSDDGDTLAVGATGESSNATGINGDQADNSAANSGAAYVFTRDGTIWSQQAYVKASDTSSYESFGKSISLSSDGNTLAVGSNRGVVYVFIRSLNIWSQQAYLTASNSESYWFGISVNLSDDGNTLAVGAAAGIGAVYVFERGGNTWSQQAYINGSNTDDDDRFGTSISLSGDGNTLAVGALREDSSTSGINSVPDNFAGDAGAVYVFSRSGSNWSQQAYVKASNTNSGDEFGSSVSLSGDGNILVSSAARESSNAIGLNGNQTDNSAANSGAAYVFTRDGTIWSQQAYVKASNTDVVDHFGLQETSAYLSGDGNTLAVGAFLEDSGATGIGGDQENEPSIFEETGAVYLY